MKPFDLQKFLAGEPATTIGGHKIVNFRYDKVDGDLFPLKVIIKVCNIHMKFRYSIDGQPFLSINSNYFLCMKEPETWINVFYDKDQDTPWLGVNRYNTEEEAKENLTDHKWYQTSIKLKL